MVIQTATGGNYSETHGLYIKNTAAGFGLRVDDAASDTSPFVVDASGRVGIGTTSPVTKLHVQDNFDTNDSYGYALIENTTVSSGQASNAGVNVKSYSGTSQFMQWENLGLRFGSRHVTNTGVGDVYITAGADSVKLVIKASGNVGIGTTSPSAKLHLNGDGGYSWGNGTYTRLGTISRYDMGGYNSGASNVSRQLLYYAYDQANWNSQYIKVIVRHSYYYTGGEAAYILDCNHATARQLYNNNAGVGGTPFTFSNNDISGNHRVTSVTFNPGLTYHSYYFTFEWTEGINASGQTSTPAVNGISFSH
jgi:hypothetical protein